MINIIGLVILFGILFLLFKKSPSKSKPRHTEVPPSQNIAREYQKKHQFFNRSEATFYQMLSQALDGKYLIFSKTRVEDFITAKISNWHYRNPIKSCHVDFLICDAHTSEPLLAIEIDGGSHHRKDRQIRDQKLDAIYQNAGMQILHVKTGFKSGMDFATAIERIKQILPTIAKTASV